MEREGCEDLCVVAPAERQTVSGILVGAVVLLIIVGTLGAAFGGPALSDHEAIVAQCARNMRLSGDWVVPQYLGTPWFRKPPLPHITWYGCAAAIDTVDEVDKVAALARGLDAAGVPPDAKVLWADRRPDARLSFYHNRQSTYLVTPEEIVGRMVDRTNQKQALQELVLVRADALLGAAEPVYLVLEQRHYDQLSTFMLHKGRLVVSAGSEFERKGKHWVVVSNASTP